MSIYSTIPIHIELKFFFFQFSEGRSHNVRRDLTSSPRMDAGNHGVTAFSANSKTNEQNEPAVPSLQSIILLPS